MKLTLVLLTAAALQVSAKGNSQTVTFSGKDVPLEQVFSVIKQQTGYVVAYDYGMLKGAKPVSLSARDVPLQDFLNQALHGQSLDFIIKKKTIFIKKLAIADKNRNTTAIVESSDQQPPKLINIRGRVVNENGEGVVAVVLVKGMQNGTTTDVNGEFKLKGVDENATLVISGINIETAEVKVNKQTDLKIIRVKIKIALQNEITVSAGYYTTTEKLRTGSITKVSGEDIQRQPVTDPMTALQGYVPGLHIRETSGMPGAVPSIQLRGINSLQSGTQPLYIIDGVPFGIGSLFSNSTSTSSSTLQTGEVSPFINLNSADIKSIEVLKDADATSIYGARGANGVILITTKKGRRNGLNFSGSVRRGASRAPRAYDFLNTQQYLAMRREAFGNDSLAITTANAPDLLLFDTTKYTDWQKKLIGGTAIQYDAQIGLDGGTQQTSFRLNAGYHDETTIFSGNNSNKRYSFSSNFSHQSTDQKLSLGLTTNYSVDKISIPSVSPAVALLNLPPNHPDLVDSAGRLLWSQGAYNYSLSINHPFASLHQKNKASIEHLQSNLNIRYTILPGLAASINAGYSRIRSDEVLTNPVSVQNPANNPTNSTGFARQSGANWSVEPQLEFSMKAGSGRLSALAGGSWQANISSTEQIAGLNYPSEDLMESLTSAGSIQALAWEYTSYKYLAFFGRLNYDWKEKYIVNITGRRDGSSRFGPHNQYANFLAVGSAWIFSEENFIKDKLHWLNLGKLRFSYGNTGNDQIGTYRYLNTWFVAGPRYQNVVPAYTNNPYNPDYAWEKVRKLEGGLDLGLLNNRVQLTVEYYDHLSSNLISDYNLPSQTGFSTVKKNIDAHVRNSGLEASLSVLILKKKNLSWRTGINFTRSRNKLVDYFELEKSTAKNVYTIGQPLGVYKLFHYLGLDPNTGVMTFNGTNAVTDRTVLLNPAPSYFGGFQSNFQYKAFSLNLSLSYGRQKYPSYLVNLNLPGSISNQPVQVLDRWQKAGDMATFPRYSTDYYSPTGLAWSAFKMSDGAYEDVSFLKLNNATFSYAFDQQWLNKMKIKELSVFISAQNLFTITNYVGNPETVSPLTIPPLKTITAGFNFNL